MQTILLTGAQGGIGGTIKVALEAAGARVIAVGRKDADMTSYSEIKALAERVAQDAPLDWLVLAHGFISAEIDFQKQTPEEIKATFELNTLSFIYLTQLLLPHLRPGGGVVFISSTSGVRPNGRYTTYSAAKAAVNAFSQALARNNPDYIFYSVCPGPTDTAMWQKIGGEVGGAQPPEAVATLVAELVSGTSTYKTGDIIVIRNGTISVAGGISA